jgi:hypothetical protein
MVPLPVESGYIYSNTLDNIFKNLFLLAMTLELYRHIGKYYSRKICPIGGVYF